MALRDESLDTSLSDVVPCGRMDGWMDGWMAGWIGEGASQVFLFSAHFPETFSQALLMFTFPVAFSGLLSPVVQRRAQRLDPASKVVKGKDGEGLWSDLTSDLYKDAFEQVFRDQCARVRMRMFLARAAHHAAH